MFSDSVPSVPLIRAGTVRPLGVTTLTRWSVAPEIPPLSEVGVPGFDVAGWFMIAGSAGTPKAIVERLHAEFKSIMGSDEVQQRVNMIGVIPVVSPPLAELQPFITSEMTRWGTVVKKVGLVGTQ
jgi:tripartite-type tricarboxylate transporter receptor subunit TctC